MSLSYEQFAQINLDDPFFDSLKGDYLEFGAWFARKSTERAYVSRGRKNEIEGFLYLKEEDGTVDDVEPALGKMLRLKIGTFKINAHGTRLGERFMKKIFDHALATDVRQIYVTVFPKHTALIDLLSRYGFKRAAVKKTPNGEEAVLVRQLGIATGNIAADYPHLHAVAATVKSRPRIAAYLKSPRRLTFNESGIFRHYPELDQPAP